MDEKPINVRLPDDLIQATDEHAKQIRGSRNQVIFLALKDYLERINNGPL